MPGLFVDFYLNTREPHSWSRPAETHPEGKEGRACFLEAHTIHRERERESGGGEREMGKLDAFLAKLAAKKAQMEREEKLAR